MTVIYYIGTKDQYTKGYELKYDYCERTITDEFTKQYPDGFTVTTGMGYYKHESGGTVIENTYIVTILDNTNVNFDLVNRLKFLLNQECIAVQVIEDNTMFI